MSRGEVLYKLKKHLQLAIELEHATLPPYLCAFWSIHGHSPRAREAAHLILSVAHEEMLHLGLACNILNAIGGSPSLNGKAFIPDYPCALPGHSQTANPFIVHLDKCSKESIYTFMHIELPQKELHTKFNDGGWASIGEFYEEIIQLLSIPLLEDGDFKNGKQTDNDSNPAKGKLYAINSREDALMAINEIIDQGEGLASRSHHDQDNELTHYWKFKKIYKHIEDGTWDYEQDVYPMAANPDTEYFTEEAKGINHQFNKAYSQMLNALHDSFNSEKPNLNVSIDLMFKLGEYARKLMQIPLVNKDGNAGPTFEYITD